MPIRFLMTRSRVVAALTLVAACSDFERHDAGGDDARIAVDAADVGRVGVDASDAGDAAPGDGASDVVDITTAADVGAPPDAGTCTAALPCDPVSGDPGRCGTGNACVVEVLDGGVTAGCASAGTRTVSAMCVYANDCQAGLSCLGSGSSWSCYQTCCLGDDAPCTTRTPGTHCSGHFPVGAAAAPSLGYCE